MPRLIIGLLSCRQEVDGPRQQQCRETWMLDAVAAGVDVLFLVGGAKFLERCGDTLWLPVGDTYPELPQKTRAWFAWALEHTDATWLWKGDSDTYIAIPRLIAFQAPPGAEYVGQEPGGRWKGYPSGGAGYGLSRKAAAIVAEKLAARRGAEDLLVGQVLRRAGIRPTLDPRFVPYGSEERRPRPDNDLITTHRVPRAVFELCHKELR